MRGASRASYAILREQLGGPGLDSRIGDELFAVTGLLDAEHGLRRALSDPGKPAAEKAAVAHQLLRGKVSAATENLTAAATEQRWGSPSDLSVSTALSQRSVTEQPGFVPPEETIEIEADGGAREIEPSGRADS